MITVNLYYKGTNGNARAFVEEMKATKMSEKAEIVAGVPEIRQF